MRILFISYEFPPLGGGGGTTCKYLAKALAATGTEIKVLTAGFSGLPLVEKIDGYEIRRVKCRRTSESRGRRKSRRRGQRPGGLDLRGGPGFFGLQGHVV